MPALSKLLIENRALMIAAAAVAIFVGAVLILLVFRLAFGRRLRMQGGRARQMRLGIVDAFDLDRQRQLVIVRRDNVEHLVMIGGPNDILIESQIIRTEARGRDKDTREKEIRDKEPAHVPAPSNKPAPIEPKLPLPPTSPEPQPIAAAQESSAGATPVNAPSRAPIPSPGTAPGMPGLTPVGPGLAGPGLGRPPSTTPPPRRPPPSQPAPVRQPIPSGEMPQRPLGAPQVGAPVSSGSVGPSPVGPSPGFLRTPPRQAPQAPTPPQAPPVPSPPPASKPPAPQDEASPSPPAVDIEPPVAGPPVPSLEGLESLEEEMAKLLGRGSSKP